jgi:hypothetical protein
MASSDKPTRGHAGQVALRFVLMIGVVSFFADFVYEGGRSIAGPFLETLGATGAIVGVVAGLGELLGYGLRFFSGRISERTRQFWPMTLFGYFVQMAAVPSLAFARNWQTAAVLIVLERVGKAIRNPPRDVMLSHAGKEMGIGWAFGLHEGLDQAGALVGPLMLAVILAYRGDYRLAFAALAIPAVVTCVLIVVTKFLYPRPEDLEPHSPAIHAEGMGRSFWIYLVRRGAGRGRVRGLSADRVPPAEAWSGLGDLDPDLLFRRDGDQWRWVAAVWPAVRPLRRNGADPADVHLHCIRAAGVPGRIYMGAGWGGAVGTRHGRARIHHSGGGCDDGSRGTAAFSVRTVHRGLRHLLVPGQRGDRVPV